MDLWFYLAVARQAVSEVAPSSLEALKAQKVHIFMADREIYKIHACLSAGSATSRFARQSGIRR
ncbi:hypothetical protein VNPA152081_15110 [Pseudomonas aeruginosa]|nr:hypothetical protein VNPA141826_18120 [Pseudomonas aeruginosa]GLF76440.1 hypothetical protein VNPA152081_15110 [Pseudomonas aeruginosa]